jgi:diphthine methyl ester acylhydrolase
MRTHETGMPIDSLAHGSGVLVAGGYRMEDGVRSGKVFFYDKENVVQHEVPSSGTLDVKTDGGCVYLANSRDVGVVDLKSRAHAQRATESINTYISIGEGFIAVSNTGGEVSLYGRELEPVRKARVSADPVWVVEAYGREMVSGCEGGSLSFSDARAEGIHRILQRGCGITSVYAMDEYLYVGSYDESIEVLDKRMYGVVRRARVGGGVWRILSAEGHFYVACMHEGAKVFDMDFNLLQRHPTASMVYAMIVHERSLIFTSFYDQKLYIADI